MKLNKTHIEQSWLSRIGTEFDRPYMENLQAFLDSERANGHAVYPREDHVFNALNHTKFDDVRVVILGQDPYHGAGQAHGLSFSVPDGVKIPPSLRNMYKELERDFGVTPPSHGNLTRWAEQGVLLLNATLTVQADKAGSHQNKGWEDFTDAVIRAVNDGRDHVAFMLWGSYAQKKGAFIDRTRHLVLTAPHPSPLSAHRGFIGCGHFRAANDYLVEQGRAVVQWI
ncbi:uracil-DNA glycosylase [Micavibrio aeruginosavorus]|uniref:uracil-DNA glycosylase n=1 Tax=Micavibrio aeruginosavorus TaxID=349221 RepID=UPI003F4ADE8E